MRKALDERGYETIKSIGKGAFGEVVVARKSMLWGYLRIVWETLCDKNHIQSAGQEETVPAEVHRPGNRNHEKTRSSQHRQAINLLLE